MGYYNILRMAADSTQAKTCKDESTLKRTLPAIPTQRANTTGMVIDGQFEMFRNRTGQMVFIGQDGQYIIK